MPHSNSSTVVSPTFPVSDFGVREPHKRSAIVKMVVDGAAQVSKTGRAWLVGPELEVALLPGRG